MECRRGAFLLTLQAIARLTGCQIVSALHRRFPAAFTPGLVSTLFTALAPPPKGSLASLAPELREKEDSSRVSRQRPILRVSAELALVGIIRDAPGRSGGDWVIKVVKDLVSSFLQLLQLDLTVHICHLKLSNDPTLSSLPLLSSFLKSYSFPYLGITPPANIKQVSATTEVGTLSEETTKGANGAFPALTKEEDELVEKDIRDRFKKMCEGYFESVSKKLVIEHNVRSYLVSWRTHLRTHDVSVCKSKTDGIMRHIFAQERYLKIDNKRTRG